jgi:hypothetical protein
MAGLLCNCKLLVAACWRHGGWLGFHHRMASVACLTMRARCSFAGTTAGFTSGLDASVDILGWTYNPRWRSVVRAGQERFGWLVTGTCRGLKRLLLRSSKVTRKSQGLGMLSACLCTSASYYYSHQAPTYVLGVVGVSSSLHRRQSQQTCFALFCLSLPP